MSYKDSCVVKIFKYINEAKIKFIVDEDGEHKQKDIYWVRKSVDINIFNYFYFDFDRFSLVYNVRKELLTIVHFLKLYKNISIELIGYADDLGDEKYNNVLSKKRANTVCNYLIANGISKKRIKCIAGGEVMSKMNAHQRSRARSVVIKFGKQ